MLFHVHALDARQQVVALSLEAASESVARALAEARGLTVFAVKTSGWTLRLRKASSFKPMLFSVELMSLLDAGLNLVEAIQTLAEKQEHEVLSGIRSALQRGEPFSQALAAFPQHFAPLYVATVKSAERSGNIKEALGRYISHQEELERVRKKVVSASIYPAILIAVGALVLGFLVLYVVPRFAQVYEDMAGKLPFFSQLLLAWGSFIGKHALMVLSAFILAIGAALFGFSRPAFRAWLGRKLWQLPALGERMKTYQLARLYRTSGMLMRAGIPALRALEMVDGLLAVHLRPQLFQARKLVEEGHAMSTAFIETGLATPVAARMMRVGERSGDMGRMLGEIARFHDDEMARFIDWFTRAFEPVLMAVLGLAVGMVVVLMYMPIFELAGSIQ
jgi:general secretion pathway protein F